MAHPEIDLRLKFPFTMLVVAPSSGGKSTWTLELIKRRNEIMTQTVDKVIYVYTEMQDSYRQFSETNSDVIFTDDKEKINEYIDRDLKLLIIFDDKLLDFQQKENSYITDWFVKKSHHKNCSVIVLIQQLYAKNLRTCSINSKYIVLFPSPRDCLQYYCLSRQMYPANPLFLVKAFEHATQKMFHYLFIDLHSQTDPRFRLRNQLYPSSDMVIYVPPQYTNITKYSNHE